MTAIDREPGGSTMIRISYETKQLIEEEKIIPREPLNDCIKRLIQENRKFKPVSTTLQTKEKMEKDLKEFVLNPNIPDTGHNHRDIYQKAHPDEVLTQDNFIHHINGNHDDNRVENLKKVTAKEHGEEHAKLRRG